MINPELIDYIKQQLVQGMSKEAIQQSLVSTAGWSISDVAEAFSAIEGKPIAPAPFSPVPMGKKRRGWMLANIGVILLLLCLVAFYFYSKIGSPQNPAMELSQTAVATTSDMFASLNPTVPYKKLSPEENSLTVWSQVKSNTVSKSDQDFLGKYIGTYSSTTTVPLSASLALLGSPQNKQLLDTYNAHSHDAYQCSMRMGDVCASLNTIREASKLAALSAITLLQQKKYSAAQSEAENIISTGKQMTAHADDLIPLLLGWEQQKLGYSILNAMGSKINAAAYTADAKAQLIADLRQEQKNVLQFMYTSQIEFIDYVTSSKNKPVNSVLNADEEDILNVYRKGAAASPGSWNPTETKRYFYSSIKVALANVDFPCGSVPADSKVEVGFDPKNTHDENYVGKTMYSSMYASFDTVSVKRCEIEARINAINNQNTATQPAASKTSPAAPVKTNSTPSWQAKIVGGQLSEKDRADVVSAIMKMVAVVNSDDIASFRKYAAEIVTPEQLAQLQKTPDDQVLALMKLIGPMVSQDTTPEMLVSSKAVWTIQDADHVQIKVQTSANSSYTIKAARENGVWY